MRLNTVSISAAGSTLLTLDPHQMEVGQSITMYGSNNINATSQVDGTISDLTARIPVTVSRSVSTVTVTFPTAQPHRLGGTTDYVVISGTGISSIDGVYVLASVSSNTVITYTSSASGTLASTAAVATPVRTFKAVIASASVSSTAPAVPAVSTTTAPIQFLPMSGLVLQCTSYVAGTTYLDVLQSGLR